MQPSYGERQREIHSMLLKGELGCPFAMQAAQRGEIMYTPSPRNIDVNTLPNAYIAAITKFARSRTSSVLIALPETDSPVSEEECTAYSHELFSETVSSMQFASAHVLDELLPQATDDDAQLFEYAFINPHASRAQIFRLWQENRARLKEMPRRTAGMNLLREHTKTMEPVFGFSMDPSYAPMTCHRFPRWSPHFLTVINWQNDLQNLKATHPNEHAATKSWMRASVGYDYVQGYRIPQQPERPTASDKLRWRPQN